MSYKKSGKLSTVEHSDWINQKEIQEYLTDVRKYTTLSRKDEHELIDKIKDGCKTSKTKLIHANLRFVISVAKKYQYTGAPLADLISEGNYGLLIAAEKFDYNQKDVKFISYAVWWIKQSIIDFLNKHSRTIRLPSNVLNDISKNSKIRNSNNNETDSSELIDLSHLPTIERLDVEIDDEGHSLYDIIPDMDTLRPDSLMDNERDNLKSALTRIMKNLSETESIVILRHFGLDGEEATLSEIADDLNITKERVRQIKNKAIRKIQSNSYQLFELM